MGTASIVFGIIGICISWLPYGCWLGALFGVLACAFGVPSITRWYRKAGYGPWGVSGIVLGLTAFVLGFSYSVKHAAGALDGIVFPLEGTLPVWILIPSSGLVATGLILARKRQKRRIAGEVMALIGIAVMGLSGAWGLTSADRSYEQGIPSSSVDQ